MRLLPACTTAFAFGGCLAAIVGAFAPAHAGDLSNDAPDGIRGYGSAGVPVPMPQTYEETFKWYIRGDVGSAFRSSGKVDIGGWPITVRQPNEWQEQSIVSFGFGRYITPSLRTEFTLDYRTERKLASGTQITPNNNTITLAVAGTSAFNTYSLTQNEEVGYQNSTLLMSGFYDFNRGGRLRPYVGAGVGLAIHQLSRTGQDTYTCTDGLITQAGVPPVVTVGCSTTNGLVTSYSNTSNANSIGYGLAAQLSGGVTYDIAPRTHWDTGYRILWQSGRIGVSSMDGLSQLHIADRIDHELRTGVRWDLW